VSGGRAPCSVGDPYKFAGLLSFLRHHLRRRQQPSTGWPSQGRPPTACAMIRGYCTGSIGRFSFLPKGRERRGVVGASPVRGYVPSSCTASISSQVPNE
jgi:hypothetical protein